MVILIFVFIILILFNYYLNSEHMTSTSKEDNKNFEKYKKYSNKLESAYGSCNYTPSHLVEEVPQVSWNGYFINNLEIKEKYRKQGYGTKLMNKLINQSKKEGKLHLISQVVAKNVGAVRLHEKLGFVVHDKGLNSNNEVVLIYLLYL